jgi:outer membrane protein, multidrug efflux system
MHAPTLYTPGITTPPHAAIPLLKSFRQRRPPGPVRRSCALLALTCLGLGGCFNPLAVRPDSPVEAPTAWASALDSEERAEIGQWWSRFGDPELDALVARTLAGNFDLAAARARVLALRAQASATGSASLPQVGAAAEGGLLRDDLLTGRFPGIPDQSRAFFQGGFDASWELDLFGGIAARSRAAEADAEVAALSAEDLAVTLTAETARHWLELRGNRERLRILNSRIATERERAHLLADRVRAGLATDSELAVVEADVATLEASVPVLEEAVARTGFRLAVLSGEPPVAAQHIESGHVLPTPPVIPHPGLPAELLARRPDVRAAVLRLDAAGALIDAAEAERYPKVTLSGLLASNGEDSRTFSIGPGLVYQLLPRIRLPLFTGERLKAQVKAREAEQEVARQQWGQVMLIALEDVEGSLTGVARERERLEATRSALEQARLAVELAAARERGGLEDYFPVLDARRRVWELEDAETQSSVRLLTQTVALFKALGGGWTGDQNAGLDITTGRDLADTATGRLTTTP